jgi:hypothetical protein
MLVEKRIKDKKSYLSAQTTIILGVVAVVGCGDVASVHVHSLTSLIISK